MGEPMLLSRKEAARRYGVSLRTLDYIVKGDPTFPVVHIGARVLIHRELADQWFTEFVQEKCAIRGGE